MMRLADIGKTLWLDSHSWEFVDCMVFVMSNLVHAIFLVYELDID